MQVKTSGKDAAAELTRVSVAGGDAMMRRLAESVRACAQARGVWIARRLPGSRKVEVTASIGPGTPEAGTRMARVSAGGERKVISLTMDGAAVGAVVVEGMLGPVTAGMLSDLGELAELCGLVLHSQSLVDNARRECAREAGRRARLMAGAAYHIRNALVVMGEYLDLIELDGEMNERQRQHVERARLSGAAAGRLAGELKELGSLERGMVGEAMQTDPTDLIRAVLRSHGAAAAEADVKLTFEHGSLPLLSCPAETVRQILDTLLSNALRYSPPGAHVTVRAGVRAGRRAGDPDEWLRIDVVDMGPGVAEGEAVFDEVRRLEQHGTPGFRLALSRRAARVLGGDVTLRTAPGSGSTFTVWLPVTGPAASVAAGPAAGPTGGAFR